MEKNKKLIQPLDLQSEYGFTRCRSYEIFNDPSLPVIHIGRRKYVSAEAFEQWLERKAQKQEANQ